MIRIEQPSDINWINLYRVVYQHEPLEIDAALLGEVDAARMHFEDLIARGIPCYGVTTSLGKLVEIDPGDDAEPEITRNILRERASAFGEPEMPGCRLPPWQPPARSRRRRRHLHRVHPWAQIFRDES